MGLVIREMRSITGVLIRQMGLIYARIDQYHRLFDPGYFIVEHDYLQQRVFFEFEYFGLCVREVAWDLRKVVRCHVGSITVLCYGNVNSGKTSTIGSLLGVMLHSSRRDSKVLLDIRVGHSFFVKWFFLDCGGFLDIQGGSSSNFPVFSELGSYLARYRPRSLLYIDRLDLDER